MELSAVYLLWKPLFQQFILVLFLNCYSTYGFRSLFHSNKCHIMASHSTAILRNFGYRILRVEESVT